MKKVLKLASVLVLGLGFGQAWATGVVDATLEARFSCTADDGAESTYEIYLYTQGSSKLWADAQAFAEGLPATGETGHLATFRDATEENCVLAVARDELHLGTNQQLWIGLFQNLSSKDYSEPGGGWEWVTGEPLDYINWANGEPNQAGTEDHGTIGRFGYAIEPNASSGWNDEAQTRNSLVGFVVEFDNTSDAQNCLEGEDFVPPGQIGIGGCNPSGFQIVELPNGLDGQLEGKTITQAGAKAKLKSEVCDAELVGQDPRVDTQGNVIDNRILDLSEVFDIPANTAFMRADLVGSPCLALVIGDSNFDFSDLINALPNGGVYTTTQFPELVPGMFTLDKVGPLGEQPDLQFVPQASFQTDDRFLLIEEAASPFTNDVFNPSRKKTFEYSFFPLNTREVCLFIDPSLDPSDGRPYFEAVLQCKVDLAVEYFDNLDAALTEAGPNLIDPSLNKLRKNLNKARSMIKNRKWVKARTRLTDLLDGVLTATWNVDFRNDPGNLTMRLENLLWRIDQLEQAENELP